MKYFRWILVVLLTPISILALGVVYNSLKLNQFEWGSVSDWVSSASNVVMALSAGYGVFKAVRWLKFRKKELAIESIKQLLTDYDILIDKINRHHYRFSKIPSDCIFNKDLLEKYNAIIEDLAYDSISIAKRLDSLLRWDVTLKEKKVKKIFDLPLQYCDEVWRLIYAYKPDYDELQRVKASGNEYKVNIMDEIKKHIDEEHRLLSSKIDDLFLLEN
ncbi:hypothetical protein [Pectobacterium odoriferum]|uniref:hypothetical protein n=1 Tax=Pectobacterium odoriferum TaxID=78398 RepID=UPI000CD24E32|nr:hypothetical protein [Pectobacterium odoriferum]POD99244.1 hypothetical protein BV916_22375 [Pectobacterium odoriferum]